MNGRYWPGLLLASLTAARQQVGDFAERRPHSVARTNSRDCEQPATFRRRGPHLFSRLFVCRQTASIRDGAFHRYPAFQ